MRPKPVYVANYGMATRICIEIVASSASLRNNLLAHLASSGFPATLLSGRIFLRDPRPWYEVSEALQSFAGVAILQTTSNRQGSPHGKQVTIFSDGYSKWTA